MWDGMIESDSAAGAAFGVPQFSPMSVTPRRLIYRDAKALLRFVEPPMYPPSYLDEPLGQCLLHHTVALFQRQVRFTLSSLRGKIIAMSSMRISTAST